MEATITSALIALGGGVTGGLLAIGGNLLIDRSRSAHEDRVRHDARRTEIYARLLYHLGELVLSSVDDSEAASEAGSVADHYRGCRRGLSQIDFISSKEVRILSQEVMDAVDEMERAAHPKGENLWTRASDLNNDLRAAMRRELGTD